MFEWFTFLGSSLLVASGLALLSVILLIGRGLVSSIRVGPWQYNPLVGSANRDPYVRAQIAIAGLLALSPSEAVYLVAQHDSAGDPLQGSCTYRIEGINLPARWWSLTAYGSNFMLMANDVDRYAYTSLNLDYDADQSFTILVSHTPQTGNWIPIGAVKSFDLLLRLYNPDPDLIANLEATQWPTITKESADAS